MSGILCVRETSGTTLESERLLAALRLMTHRGAAAEGTRVLAGVFLGVRSARGALGEGSAQAAHEPQPRAHRPGGAVGAPTPLASGDGHVLVAVDGRLHDPRGDASGPEETLLRAYLDLEDRAFDQLRGVFAAVVWDARTGRLLLARDPLGVRPLYYAVGPGGLIAASEIKVLLHLDPALREIDPARVRAMVRDSTVDDWTDTAFAKIRPVPPGCVLTVDSRGFSVRRYWTLRPAADPSLTAAAVREMLAEAIARATPSDVPVGLSLSGGIDSSAIAGFLFHPADGRARNVQAFSVRPPETTDESALIDATVRHTGLRHTYLPLDDIDPVRGLERLLDAHDEPIVHSGAFYQFLLRGAMAEAGCRAVLVGYGADEIFGGYPYLASPFLVALARRGRWGDVLRFSRGARGLLGLTASAVLRQAARWAADRARSRAVGGIKKVLRRAPSSLWHGGTVPADRVLAHAPASQDGRRRAASAGPLAGGAADASSAWQSLNDVAAGRVFLSALVATLRHNVPLLVRVEDRNAAAHGLELCAPFMDRQVVERALAIPFHRFMEAGRNKAVLRDAAAPLLAPEVSAFPKKLPTPGSDAHLAFGALAPELRDMVASASFRESGIWAQGCDRAFAEDVASKRRGPLWFRVYMVQKWYDRVVCPPRFERGTFSFGG